MTSLSYSELRKLKTFEDRFEYLKLNGAVGAQTFQSDRMINQIFYTSPEWRRVRKVVLVRDYGCDLGVRGYEIPVGALVHHMNPITPEDLIEGREIVLDPNFLITLSVYTHRAIHYGTEYKIPRLSMNREPGDTKLW